MDKLKILVVDDESRMRKLVKDFLEKKNFRVLDMLYSKPETVWKQWTFFMRKKILH